MTEALYEAFVSIGWWEILVTMCNTLITFLIIKKFLYKPVRKMLAARIRRVLAAGCRYDEEGIEQERKKAMNELEGRGRKPVRHDQCPRSSSATSRRPTTSASSKISSTR